ncbi:MAG: Rieske 2Fe-2S domain-containing protein [Rhodospirillales bacterium]
MPYVRNAWYVGAWSREIGAAPVRRTMLGENLVLFRTSDGAPVALHDRCPHRFLPLSKGTVKGDLIQCGYHGLTFDGAGRCVHSPTQAAVPPHADVRAFPAVERFGLVWIWMGDPARADAADLCPLPQFGDAAWRATEGDPLYVKAGYLLLCDNLCDPTHVTYVHPTTLGSPEVPDVPVTHQAQPWGVSTTRWTRDCAPVGLFQAFGNYAGTVDRWQHYHMHVPSAAIIDTGTIVAGSGDDRSGGQGRVQIIACHFMTPVSESETIDYWLHLRNFATDDAGVDDRLNAQLRIAFAEDKDILEAIEVEEQAHRDAPKAGLDLDASAGLFRRMVNQRIREERTAAAAE